MTRCQEPSPVVLNCSRNRTGKASVQPKNSRSASRRLPEIRLELGALQAGLQLVEVRDDLTQVPWGAGDQVGVDRLGREAQPLDEFVDGPLLILGLVQVILIDEYLVRQAL